MSEKPDVIVYTDGACSGNPGRGGWAAILKHPATGRVRKLSGGDPDTTNNRMEMIAAIEGLRAIKGEGRLRVRLVSDSKYVLQGLTEWIGGWIANGWRRGKKPGSPPVKNVDLWQELHGLAQRHDMTYEHVRGHAGHPENEECDRMAVAAIRGIGMDERMTEPVEEEPTPPDTPGSEGMRDARHSPQGICCSSVRRVSTGTPWEQEVGYCRAVRAGTHIYVTGTAPVGEAGATFAPGDAYRQARRCLEIIELALGELGASMADVVRTRMFVTDISRWEEYGRAHREFFADHPPATTMVEVKSLIAPDMLIEIEADGVCGAG